MSRQLSTILVAAVILCGIVAVFCIRPEMTVQGQSVVWSKE